MGKGNTKVKAAVNNDAKTLQAVAYEAGSAQQITAGNQSDVVDATDNRLVFLTAEDDGNFEVGVDPTASATTHYIVGGSTIALILKAGHKVAAHGTTIHLSVGAEDL